MNLSDPTTLISVVALLGAAAYALWPSRKVVAKSEPTREIPAQSVVLSSVNRGRQLIEFAQEIGLDNAGKQVETILGNAKAAQVINDFRSAFTPEPLVPKS